MKSEQTSSVAILLPPSLAAVCIILFLSGCSLVGVRSVEEANYSVLRNQDQYQVREYETLVVAETLVNTGFDEAGNVAFKRLFAYISGDNKSASKIAMTAPVMALKQNGEKGEVISMTTPVTGEKSALGWRFAFVLPAAYTLENAPLPNSPEVKLALVPARKVAVMRYSGSWNETSYETNLEMLEEWMRQNQLEADSLPRVAGYDPPWTLPFLRRNEIMIDVKS